MLILQNWFPLLMIQPYIYHYLKSVLVVLVSDLLLFHGYTMAPPYNGACDFFMAETTYSDAQSDTEDSNLDSLLQHFKSPSFQDPQECVANVCGVSNAAEEFDLMCDQSSSHSQLGNISRSRLASAPG